MRKIQEERAGGTQETARNKKDNKDVQYSGN